MDHSSRLALMLIDMQKAPAQFKPANFWQTGLPSILEDLRRRGFEDFRDHSSARQMYVPGFSSRMWQSHQGWLEPLFRFADRLPTRSRAGSRIRGFFDGTAEAKRQHQILCASHVDQRPRLENLEESLVGGEGERVLIANRYWSRTWLNYLRGLNFLKKLVDTSGLTSVLELGGGYGGLGEILLKADADIVYVDVDIPPVAAVATFYLEKVFGEGSVLTYEISREMDVLDIEQLSSEYKCAVLCPWQLPRLRGQVDLFSNFISFQEMEPDIVANYIELVQPLTRSFVLIRNSRHGKPVAKRDGELGVLSPVTTDDVIAQFDAFDLLGRDSHTFGDGYDGFESEVVCMRRASVG